MLNDEELIKKVQSYNRFFNRDALSKAYNFALSAHKNQKRDWDREKARIFSKNK